MSSFFWLIPANPLSQCAREFLDLDILVILLLVTCFGAVLDTCFLVLAMVRDVLVSRGARCAALIVFSFGFMYVQFLSRYSFLVMLPNAHHGNSFVSDAPT